MTRTVRISSTGAWDEFNRTVGRAAVAPDCVSSILVPKLTPPTPATVSASQSSSAEMEKPSGIRSMQSCQRDPTNTVSADESSTMRSLYVSATWRRQ